MKILISKFPKYKIFFIFLLQFSFSIASDSIRVPSNDILIDFQLKNLNEKVKTLRSVKNNSHKVIFYLQSYKIEVKNIIFITEDSIKIELLNNWWWNKPRQPMFNNNFPNESMSDQSEASYSEVIAINDITAIQLIKEKPLILLLLPGILVFLLMKSIGL
ncbi:MAG: hypothetical protein H8E85_02050 [Candidatus Marinimicrobia bacterium]|nr:hypothetical protein [Candidatus Neomarinimicrobiota bacterium]